MRNILHARFGVAWACIALLGACAHTGGYGAMRAPPDAPQLSAAQGNDREMYLDLIRQMQERGLFYASLAHIDAYRGSYGDSPELRRLNADALRETGQAEAAMAMYRGLLGSEEAAAAWHGIGLIQAARGQLGDATHALDEAVRRSPIDITYLGDLGFARLRAGDIAGAREPLAKAAELDGTNTKAAANLALLLTIEGDGTRAERVMQAAALTPLARQTIARMAHDLRQPAPRPSASNGASPNTRPADVVSGSLLERFGATTTQGPAHDMP